MSTFVIVKVNKFFEKNYIVPTQQDLLQENGYQETKIELFLENAFEAFDAYSCHFDRKINKRIKIKHDEFYDHYYDPSDFFLYYNSKSEIAIINTSHDTAKLFCNQLNEHKNFKLELMEFNLHEIIDRISDVNGLWISDIKEMNLSSAGYFGTDVHRNQKAEELIKEAKISSISASFTSRKFSRSYNVLISKKGVIVTHEKMAGPYDAVALTNEIFSRLIEPLIKNKVTQ
ncbi:hypothetical protein BKP35_18360 [Anaerobacillus arseniciselenatis]|uniref:Uncharacterized protein n=1 Tax=Anaerobacillus arseniciselenatis TaxID=85682 RepID=A0A1S2L589_9BACI|nr:hypothetical protein [Anaerobacillus arseniciselenatis]OIJ07648.1 hypothetical protein BKP35_18360 [Anaerobacillus arseniciselenatis]